MKTKVKFLSVIAIFAVAMGVNASLKMNNTTESLSLSEMVEVSEANAECKPFNFAHGRCLQLSQICVFDTQREDCDPYSM